MRLIVSIIISVILWTGAPPVQAMTTITDDTKGVLVTKTSADSNRFAEPMAFDQLQRDPVYVNITTPKGLLVHIESNRVVKYVFYLKPDSFPSRFLPDDLAAVKAKIDELQALGKLDPGAEKVYGPHLKFLQDLYNTESAKYKQSVTNAAQQSENAKEQEEFDKKCELMRLDLVANRDNIKRSEEIVKEMAPLASRSKSLTDVLDHWNQEKKHALDLASEGKRIWQDALKAHPECFAALKEVSGMPNFPADLKKNVVDLFNRLDQFKNTATYPQVLDYCAPEVPAYYLLSQQAALVEKVKAKKFDDAAALGQKALGRVESRQIVAPYEPVYATFKNYTDLVVDLKSRFERQLAKARQSEDELTNKELLVEYQKAYDLIPDPKVATKIEELKARIKSE